MRLKDTFYRGHDPRWSFSPLSGEGAKVYGGRFNPPGVEALYLASTIVGAIAEIGHGFAHRLVPPMTIVSYEVDVDDIVDLTTDQGRRAANIDLADMACAWRLDLVNGREPASWRIAERLRQTAPGLLAPSFARDASQDMHNLVLWKWGPDLPYRVAAYDPSGCRKISSLGHERWGVIALCRAWRGSPREVLQSAEKPLVFGRAVSRRFDAKILRPAHFNWPARS